MKNGRKLDEISAEKSAKGQQIAVTVDETKIQKNANDPKTKRVTVGEVDQGIASPQDPTGSPLTANENVQGAVEIASPQNLTGTPLIANANVQRAEELTKLERNQATGLSGNASSRKFKNKTDCGVKVNSKRFKRPSNNDVLNRHQLTMFCLTAILVKNQVRLLLIRKTMFRLTAILVQLAHTPPLMTIPLAKFRRPAILSQNQQALNLPRWTPPMTRQSPVHPQMNRNARNLRTLK